MRNKKQRKTLGLMMTALLLVLLFQTAEAIPSAAPEKGNLVIHKYRMEDIGHAGRPNNGEEITVSGSAVSLAGIEFTVNKVKPDVSGQYPATAAAVSSLDPAFPERSGSTDPAGILRFDNLPQGVYLVTETDSKGADGMVYAPSDPFLVAVPMTNTAGDGWLETVHIYPKNQSMIPVKTAGGGQFDPKDPQNNETIEWTVTIPIPVSETTSEFKIVDEIDPLLLIKLASVTVETVASKLAAGNAGTVVPSQYYAVSFAGAENKLIVTFEAAGVKYLQEAENGFLRINFSTDLTDDALGLLIENNAVLEFTNQEGTYTQDIPESERPKAYTGTIGITKVTDEEGNEKPLSGAVFKVAKTKQDALSGNFLKDISGADIQGVSDAYGYLELRGVPYGADGVAPDASTITDTFWIMEITAPAGYSLMDGPVEVTFNYEAKRDSAGNVINYFNRNIKVFNTKQFTLPGTGSGGIIAATILGAILLAGVILIVVRRRKNEI